MSEEKLNEEIINATQALRTLFVEGEVATLSLVADLLEVKSSEIKEAMLKVSPDLGLFDKHFPIYHIATVVEGGMTDSEVTRCLTFHGFILLLAYLSSAKVDIYKEAAIGLFNELETELDL